jgi:IPT/TIG domain
VSDIEHFSCNSKPFRVTPVVLSFTPTSGKVGTFLTIKGNSLTQTKAVIFGGVRATNFSVKSDTEVVATVPTGTKTGKIGSQSNVKDPVHARILGRAEAVLHFFRKCGNHVRIPDVSVRCFTFRRLSAERAN